MWTARSPSVSTTAASPPTVLLSPRATVRLPSAPVDIPAPLPAPSAPGGGLAYQILPVLLAAVGMGIILLAGNLQSGGATVAVLLFGSVLLVGGGAGVSVMMHRAQHAAYHRAASERVAVYARMLASTRERLQRVLLEQQVALLEKDPSPAACHQIAVERAARLWERSPGDSDFLVLRAGLGSQPSSVPVHVPPQPDVLRPDPLIEAAHQLADWASTVTSVPVGVPLLDGRAVGVCGPRASAVEAVRGLLLQLATHHAPDEVKLVALVSADEAAEWAWLRWLPHAWSDDRRERYIASTPPEAARLSRRFDELLGRRFEAGSLYGLARARSASPLPVYVFLVADDRLAESMPVLARISEADAARPGAACLFVSTERAQLPRACRTILELATDGTPAAQLVDSAGDAQRLERLDRVPVALAERIAAALAPVRVRRIASLTGLPPQAPLLDLLGVTSVEELDIPARWRQSAPERSLAVPIGIRPGGEPLWLDLHQTADGPHGLIAGSTGSGKSALLQALLLGLGVSFHPHDVAIVLVDYKGGSTLGPLRDLPHLAGTITNLDGNLARRALVALQAEIERRQARLAQTGCDDLDAYLARRNADPTLEALPHLVLVVDEFAELKTERPDFIHQLVRAARVGRNVGIHLILATQKPRPAVDDEIWANARFRICLRVEQPQDSHDVLKRPDAATLAGRGQGYLQVGHDELFTLFQAAWSGAAYRPRARATDPHALMLVDLDGTRRSIDRTPASAPSAREPSQAEAITAHLHAAAAAMQVPPLASIWLPPLAELANLPRLLDSRAGWDGETWQPSQTWIAPVVGLVDDPAHRRQAPLRIDLPRAGNAAVYGAPGTGKTTALVTLAVALTHEHAPDDLQLYLLDSGGQALTMLHGFPHVGGVVLGDEEEKLVRLLRHLSSELARRKALFGEAGVATLPAYRAATKLPLAAVVVLIDNLPALVHTYPDVEDELAQIAQQGGTLGIHLVVTAASPTLVRLRMANSFTQTVALRLADRADYGAVLTLPEGYEPAPEPGRGLVKGRPTLECQIALPALGVGEAEQSAEVRRLAHAMDAAWSGGRPWRVRTLPQRVSLADLLSSTNGDNSAPVAPVGLAADELEPFLVDLREGPHFAIVGPPHGGKSTLLRTWLASLARCVQPRHRRLYLADFSPEAVDGRACFDGVEQVHSGGELAVLLDELEDRAPSAMTRVLAIDDLEGLQRTADSETLQRLDRLVRARRSGLHVLLVGSTSAFNASYDGCALAIKEIQTGFLIGGSDYDDLQVFGIKVPHAEASRGVPAGRGFYVRRKRYVRIKVAEPDG